MATVRETEYFEETAVRSRVSWGAILAGAAVALAAYILLNLFGLAIGLTVVAGEQLGMGTAIWMVIASLIALFIGGWVTSQCTIGESRMESVIYGLVVWGVLFTFLAWLSGVGVQLGLAAMLTHDQLRTIVDPAQQMALADEALVGEAAGMAWWSFIGVALSILAAIGGAMAGTASPGLMRERRVRPATAGGAQRPAV